MRIKEFIFLIVAFILGSCQASTETNQTDPNEWLIPTDNIILNDLKDFIPSIDEPSFISINQSTLIKVGDYVNVIKHGDIIRIYPQRITHYHEVVNDNIDDWKYSVTFCPVTGTALVWDRVINGSETTFGVSGMLYNNNLILYDRATESHWSQMLGLCVNGQSIRTETNNNQVLEMTFEMAVDLFPDAEVLSPKTGYDFPYHLKQGQNKLPGHDPFYTVFWDDNKLSFNMEDFPGEITVNNIEFNGKKLIAVGSLKYHFLTVFERELSDGTDLNFSEPDTFLPAIFQDSEGNKWDAFGEAIEGPRTGEKLKWVYGFGGFLFAFEDFWPERHVWQSN